MSLTLLGLQQVTLGRWGRWAPAPRLVLLCLRRSPFFGATLCLEGATMGATDKLATRFVWSSSREIRAAEPRISLLLQSTLPVLLPVPVPVLYASHFSRWHLRWPHARRHLSRGSGRLPSAACAEWGSSHHVKVPARAETRIRLLSTHCSPKAASCAFISSKPGPVACSSVTSAWTTLATT